MYSALYVQTTSVADAPDEIKPFIFHDARRRGIELADDSRVVILQVATTMSFISIPLGFGLTLDAVEKELLEIETELDPGAKEQLSQALDNK